MTAVGNFSRGSVSFSVLRRQRNGKTSVASSMVKPLLKTRHTRLTSSMNFSSYVLQFFGAIKS